MPIDLAQTFTPDDQLYTRLRLCYLTSFAIKSDTQKLLLTSFIIEGPVVMILAIGSNILAYASYKAFMKRKSMSTTAAFNVNTQRLAITTHVVELTEIEQRRQAKNDHLFNNILNHISSHSVCSAINNILI